MRASAWTSGPPFRTGSAACKLGTAVRSKNFPIGISSPHNRDFPMAAIQSAGSYAAPSSSFFTRGRNHWKVPSEEPRQWLQVRLGCIQLSPSCPFRRLHTFCFLRPARNYPRFWIWPSSFECQRDLNPHEQRAAQRALPRSRLPARNTLRSARYLGTIRDPG